jgi:hypothetical protein
MKSKSSSVSPFTLELELKQKCFYPVLQKMRNFAGPAKFRSREFVMICLNHSENLLNRFPFSQILFATVMQIFAKIC